MPDLTIDPQNLTGQRRDADFTLALKPDGWTQIANAVVVKDPISGSITVDQVATVHDLLASPQGTWYRITFTDPATDRVIGIFDFQMPDGDAALDDDIIIDRTPPPAPAERGPRGFQRSVIQWAQFAAAEPDRPTTGSYIVQDGQIVTRVAPTGWGAPTQTIPGDPSDPLWLVETVEDTSRGDGSHRYQYGPVIEWTGTSGGTSVPLSNRTPAALGNPTAGVGVAASRDDHVHPRQTAIQSGELADGSVTRDKIADRNVTQSKLNRDSVGSTQIEAGAVTASKIADGVLPDTSSFATRTQLAAEATARADADTALGQRIDGISAVPAADAQDVGRALRVGSDRQPFWDEPLDLAEAALGSIVDQGGKLVAVRADHAGYEYVDPPTPGGGGNDDDADAAADYVLDTYSIALSQLPVFNVDSWSDADQAAKDAGFALGWWVAGNRPTAYSDVSWDSDPIDIRSTTERLWAIRTPGGFPIKLARFDWQRGGQSAPEPSTGNYWHPFALTGVPRFHNVYYLATGSDEFEALAMQSGDRVTMQTANVSYDDLLQDTTAVQAGLDESLRHVHDLIDPITAEVAARGSYTAVTAGGHYRHGWASIAADGTDSSGNDHLTLPSDEPDYVVNVAAAQQARTPVVWTPIGSDPNEWRVELFRGGSAIVTYPEAGEYWRSYRAARNDDIRGHYDAWFLAAEASDAPVTKTWRQNDRLRLLRGAAVEAIRVPAVNLAADSVQGALGLPATAAANRGRYIKREDGGDGFEYVDAPSGGPALEAFRPYPLIAGSSRVQANQAAIRVPITSISETNPYISSLANSQFQCAAGLYDFFFAAELFQAATGNSLVSNNNVRADLNLTAHGSNVEFWQATNPYRRSAGNTDTQSHGQGSKMLRVWVPAATRIHFQMQADGQNGNGFMGVVAIDFMCLSAGAA